MISSLAGPYCPRWTSPTHLYGDVSVFVLNTGSQTLGLYVMSLPNAPFSKLTATLVAQLYIWRVGCLNLGSCQSRLYSWARHPVGSGQTVRPQINYIIMLTSISQRFCAFWYTATCNLNVMQYAVCGGNYPSHVLTTSYSSTVCYYKQYPLSNYISIWGYKK